MSTRAHPMSAYRTTLIKARDFLAFDTSISAGIQREQISTALYELHLGNVSPAVEATVLMAELIGGCA
jgi:hypothetical protein